ncbi:MAG: sodium-dependent transporter [Bacteroidales bacterium]|nr:sodium-dependent transporter [Bacteroidales bacterium]
MANFDSSQRDGFSSKFGVIAAAAGSAVGLGNIWRFPYVAGENGGGAFLLMYLAFILLIGIPVMMSEFSIGRRSQKNTFGAFKVLAPKSRWSIVGLMGIIAAFAILAFYSTVAGWTVEYLVNAIGDQFSGKSKEELGADFSSFASHDYKPLIWQMFFMILTAVIVLAGVKKGIEKYTKILMPILLVLIIAVCIRSITLPNASAGLKYLFYPVWSDITFNSVLMALGQAAFSLSIGMGCLITYGSYIKKDNNLFKTSFQVASADTLIAILSGVMIFPAVFSFGFQPDKGPDLVFIVLPNIFQTMPGGYIFSIIFFFLLTVAALTSTISVLEVVVAAFIEELKMSRKKATIVAAASISILGVFATLSFGQMGDFTIFGKTVFDILNYVSANILLTFGALLIVIFTGWRLGKSHFYDEVTNQGSIKQPLFKIIVFIIRYIAPVAIGTVAIASFFVKDLL